MRRSLLFSVVGLTLAFGINCGSVTSDGSGTGGSGGEAAKGGSGGGGATGGGGSGGGGSGGAHATGGTGGDHATGGAGGAQATGGGGGNQSTGGAGGGAAGSGGNAGAGGRAGNGGHPGTGGGGGTGTGGHAGGGGTSGTGGSAGHSADGGVTCAELASEYQAALPAAEACTPGTANQCQTLVPLALNICSNPCKHYVTDATTLNAIQAQWTGQGCAQPTALVFCPAIAIACISPGTSGYCVATVGAAPGGVCGLAVATPATL
jgi:hypothetical protein